MIYAFFLFVFVQKSFLTKKLSRFAEINLTTRGPLYTCLVFFLEASVKGIAFLVKVYTVLRVPFSLTIFHILIEVSTSWQILLQ